MNYLAHLLLAKDCPQSQLGSLMGDFVKGHVGDGFDVAVRHAIQQHRRIDSFTDAHPLILASKGRLRPELRRYSGILVDILYDHFLARHWDRFHNTPLPHFCEGIYALLETSAELMPQKMQRSMHYVVRYDLLQNYHSLRGVQRALEGVQQRFKRPVRLTTAIEDFEQHYDALEADFLAFMPDVIAYAGEVIDALESAEPSVARTQ